MPYKTKASIKCPFKKSNRPLRRYKKQSRILLNKNPKKEKKYKTIWKSLQEKLDPKYNYSLNNHKK